MCCSNFSFFPLHVAQSISNVLAKLILDFSTNFNPSCLQTLHLPSAGLTVSCNAFQFTIRCGAVSACCLCFCLFLSCSSVFAVVDMMMIATHVVSDLRLQSLLNLLENYKVFGVCLNFVCLSCYLIDLNFINYHFQITSIIL